jgi:hypothetical protein
MQKVLLRRHHSVVVLVLLLRTVSGTIKFKALGFKFKGASGPILMWIFYFLAMTLAISKT